MNMPSKSSDLRCWLNIWPAALCAVLLMVAPGCVQPLPDGDADNGNLANDNDNGEPAAIQAEIVNLKSIFPLSKLDSPVSVLYSVTGETEGAEIVGFHRQVAGSSPDSGALSPDDSLLATGLPAGTNLAFSFDPQEVVPGYYVLGIKVTDAAGDTIEALSEATINVQGAPDPEFRQPVDAVTDVEPGDVIDIRFDAQDPEGDVQWRLFYLSEENPTTVPADQLGTQLLTGSGNDGVYTWQITDALIPGRYTLGVAATDTGRSVAATVARGEEDRIVKKLDGPVLNVLEAATEPQPPTLIFTAPGSADVVLFRDEPYSVRFSGQVFEEGAVGVIDLFYDTNTSASDGFTLLTPETGLSTDQTSFALPSNLPEGTFHIGGQISDGINAVTTTYAAGTIRIVQTVTLNVTAPATIVSISPAPAGENEPNTLVAWSTSAPTGVGTVDVYYTPVTVDGTAIGSNITLLAPTSLATTSTPFYSSTSNLYRITVRLILNDGEVIEATAPEFVRVSSLPTVLWLGSLADTAPPFKGAIFEGVNFADNAGTSFAAAGDVNDDDLDDFLIAARYGKPFFVNPSGIGPGEAYLIFGEDSDLEGVFNLNSVGQPQLPGAVFAGIRTPQGNEETDGLSDVTALPDIDGDGRSELMFGFPKTNSRGHNISFEQDGVVDPATLVTLERHEQFLRGGVVIVSSTNDQISDAENADSPVILLDVVGQSFERTTVEPQETWFDDRLAAQEDEEGVLQCVGSCGAPETDNDLDSIVDIGDGFNDALADDYLTTYILNGSTGGFPFVLPEPCTAYLNCDVRGTIAPASPLLSSRPGLSGFYPDTVPDADSDTQEDRRPNRALQPFGARIIGIGIDDGFGTSVTLSNNAGAASGEEEVDPGDIIISAPNRTGRGILMGENEEDPELGGEVDGLENPPGTGTTLTGSGIAYLFPLRNLWDNPDNTTQIADGVIQFPIPPKPNQYMVGQPSHIGGATLANRIPNIDATRISGNSNDHIQNIIGIDDFNGDYLNDFAVGAPDADGGKGRVYVAFRRTVGVEGDFVLTKLEKDPLDSDRLTGVLIVTDSSDALGSSLATGVDFNGDGLSDLVIGSPTAEGGTGEVIIVFGAADLTSPRDGITVWNLLRMRDAEGHPRAARITGHTYDAEGTNLNVNAQFGFNVANAGDVDGDGLDDLLIAAPNATPRFDPNLNDGVDLLTEPGVDTDSNGVADNVDLTGAGLVYVISSKNRLDQIASDDDDFTIAVGELGTADLQGFIIAGRRAGDRLGGGDAGDVTAGGIAAKLGRGRSHGLAGGGDVDGDGRDDFLIGAVLADPRIDPFTGVGTENAGEVYLIYGSVAP
jgi:hypothetical protein